MLICRNCNSVFSEEDRKTVCENRGEFWGSPAFERISVCPVCGSDDISDAVKCDICGEYFDSDEAYYADIYRVCPVCKDKAEKKYREWAARVESEFLQTFDSIEQKVVEELQSDGVIE